MNASAAPPANPLEGLYAFTRAHLLVINGVVLASTTVVGALDFLAPRLALLPKLVYSATACIVMLMLISAFAPALVARMMGALGLMRGHPAAGRLWRNPGWQIALAILLGVTIIGFASVAKASQGGLIASTIPAARDLQASMLGLRRDVADIMIGVDAANGKLDTLVADSRDPQRDLVSRGYSVDGSGLMRAIKLDDKRAVGLFVALRYQVEWEGPLAVLLNGRQPWDGQLAAMLPRSMFNDPRGCMAQGSLLISEGKPPVAERIAVFKRVCDPAPLIAATEDLIAREAGVAPLNERRRRIRIDTAANLALLRQ